MKRVNNDSLLKMIDLVGKFQSIVTLFIPIFVKTPILPSFGCSYALSLTLSALH